MNMFNPFMRGKDPMFVTMSNVGFNLLSNADWSNTLGMFMKDAESTNANIVTRPSLRITILKSTKKLFMGTPDFLFVAFVKRTTNKRKF